MQLLNTQKKVKEMYDYVMVFSDKQFRNTIKTRDIHQFLVRSLEFKTNSNLRFSKEISSEVIRVTGIYAN